MSSDFMKVLQEKAMGDSKKVVFPEALENKILQAARRILDKGLGYPILIGEPEAVSSKAADTGISLDGITVVDHADEEKVDHFVSEYTKINSVFPGSAVKRMLKSPLHFAAMMVKLDEADCMVAGLTHTTGEVIMVSELIIGLQEGISIVSSMGIMSIPGYEGPEGDMLAISDCAVSPAPNPEELADIAISTADTVKKLLGWEPRVALLSFSTKGSGTHDRVDEVLKTLEIVRERRPDIVVDGELQLDSALVPEVAAKKIKGDSPVAGKANVLIFPDLNAGNIGVKLVQHFAKATAHGPMLQGFAKSVSDLSRAAQVDEIVGAATMAMVCAQEK